MMATRTALQRQRVSGRIAIESETTSERKQQQLMLSADVNAARSSTARIIFGWEFSHDGGKTWGRIRFEARISEAFPVVSYANKHGYLIRPFIDSESATPIGLEIED